MTTIEMTSRSDETGPSSGLSGLALQLRGVSRRYGRRWALANVDLDVPAGRAVMIAGHNGSGKSTLLRVISTALRADRGSILIEGLDARREIEEVRRRVALLGHYSNTYEAMSALQNLAVSARILGAGARREDLEPVLDRVGLEGRGDDVVTSFSAGMRKRLSFARLLLQMDDLGSSTAPRASVVLLDEPYGQLDPQGFRFVDDLILDLKARGTTILVATHLLDRGGWLCDEGIVLDHGRVVWSGPSAELRKESGLDPIRVPEEVN